MSLRNDLIARVRETGPLSIADYMAECLLHPVHGYYTTRDPLGTKGDFTTAPEISQMFGELIGLALAQSWIDQGRPKRFVLAELGPGRGTLMADVLRAARAVPGFCAAAEICLIEASPALRAVQAKTLKGHAPRWLDRVEDLPGDRPLFAVANEFFDALPVRQFLRQGAGWCERRVGLRDGALAFGLGAEAPQAALAHRLEDTSAGDLVEVCEAAAPIISALATRIAARGGATLIVDYGDWRSLGDTLQALRAHEPADVLADPGQADLTAHVDFEPLAEAARAAGCAHSRVTPQGVFLERLGITARAQALARGRSGAALDDLVAAHRRLTHPDEMGNLFKVLGLYPTQAAPPPGLAP
ncbi:MAG: SAM-dependent methyltransferase [Antarcticimicrobium sp.]|uniref:class I SAM-dependent methyltransferase n=1 Tax=Antarcticimicrobium sp. TaxID=2824147 RepID=UPI00261A2F6C|nr:SAM-dependent methyltransferase [Antarcticimicrobium sp.]MDF1717550.1 SAM-dependent methyltransferase [Antarcticimicrobium sp.]